MNPRSSKRRILVVGEGRETEYNYFVGLREAFQHELNLTATSISVRRGKGGDARGIVKHAIKEAKKFELNRKRGDRVFLLLDTEGTGRAPELPAAEALAKKHAIGIIYSCPAFEYWLLCHFQAASRRHFANCDAVIGDLDKQWKTVCKSDYDKADRDIFARLADFLPVAREQALSIDLLRRGQSQAPRCANPSTQVYQLIGLLLGAHTGERCPITGDWRLVGNAQVFVTLSQGDQMPLHDEKPVHWQLEKQSQ